MPKMQEQEQATKTKRGYMRSKLLAIILAIFVGGLGIHKMYLGRPWIGVAYLLLCWTFIPAFLALVDAIIIAVTPKQKFDDIYNS